MQVIDGDGKKLPAWEKFVEFGDSEKATGGNDEYKGKIYYHEAAAAEGVAG